MLNLDAGSHFRLEGRLNTHRMGDARSVACRVDADPDVYDAETRAKGQRVIWALNLPTVIANTPVDRPAFVTIAPGTKCQYTTADGKTATICIDLPGFMDGDHPRITVLEDWV